MSENILSKAHEVAKSCPKLEQRHLACAFIEALESFMQPYDYVSLYQLAAYEDSQDCACVFEWAYGCGRVSIFIDAEDIGDSLVVFVDGTKGSSNFDVYSYPLEDKNVSSIVETVVPFVRKLSEYEKSESE